MSYDPNSTFWRTEEARLRRLLERYVADLPMNFQIAQRKKKAAPPHRWGEENRLRLFDFTAHPSQIETPMRIFLQQAMKELREDFIHLQKKNPHNKVQALLLKRIALIVPAIQQKVQAAILANDNPNAIPAIATAENINIKTLVIKCMDKSKTLSELAKSLVAEQSLANGMQFDEVDEQVQSAKNWLLNNNSVYTAWLDYDGAKRPAGLGYAIYARLLMEDIRRTTQHNTTAKSAEWLFIQLQKRDSVIHGLSLLMAETVKSHVYDRMDDVMNELKKDRFNDMQQLVHILNSRTANRPLAAREKEVGLSKRIRFAIRIDTETADAAIARAEQRAGRTHERHWNMELREYVGLLENITRQTLEINELSSDTRLQNGKATQNHTQEICTQIMVANAGSTKQGLSAVHAATQMKALRSQIEAAAISRQVGVDHPIEITKYVCITPLFESPLSVNPEFIKTYLNELWSRIQFDQRKSDLENEKVQQRIFERRYHEIFFAGSDTSRVMGSYAAHIGVQASASAAHDWAASKGISIEVKFGSGESAFRQGGYFDPEAGLPIFKGKLNVEQQALLEESFGKAWRTLLKRDYGFNFILEKTIGISAFTAQARAGEIIHTQMAPQQLRTYLERSWKARDQSLSLIGARLHPLLKPAAQAAQTSFESIMGVEGAAKPNGLCSYPALIEYLAIHALPKLRARGLSRLMSADEAEKMEAIKNLGRVNARAISVTAASNALLPISLIEKGDLLTFLANKGALKPNHVALQMMPLRLLLREAKAFNAIADHFFQLLDSRPAFEPMASELKRRWNGFWGRRSDLRAALAFQELGINAEIFLKDPNKDKLIECFVPAIRELFDDEFESRYTQHYVEGWHLFSPALAQTLDYFSHWEKGGKDALHLQQSIPSFKDKTTQQGLQMMSEGLRRIG